jgi:hypothetical protein
MLTASVSIVTVFFGVNTENTNDTSQAAVNAAANTTTLLSTIYVI